MTRSENMEHVEVLRDIRNWMASFYWDSRVDALDAAIAALSAPQPPAEAQPVGDCGEAGHDEGRCGNASCAPPRAPVGVERLRRMVERLAAHVRPTCRELWEEAQAALAQQPAAVDEAMVEAVRALAKEWRADIEASDMSARADRRNTKPKHFLRDLEKLLKRHGGQRDDLNAWRAAFISERATRYRERGMSIESARIHAETDAALMEKTTSQQGESQ